MELRWQVTVFLILAVIVSVLMNPLISVKGEGQEETSLFEDGMEKADPEKGFVLAAENQKLILYFDNRTGGVAIEDKESGELFYSNPLDAMEDPKASDAIKQQLMSPVELVYNIRGKEGDYPMNSYEQAILLDQVAWKPIKDGIRVAMTIGRAEQRVLLPQKIGKASFENNILDRIQSEREKKQMKAFYILASMEENPNAKEDIYTLKTSATDRDRRMLEGYVKSTGYTYEMLQKDYEDIGYESSDTAFPSFHMNIDYILIDNSLTVKLDRDGIVYDDDIFNLISISLLNYFGAGKTGEDGYIFLPDGSGTLIDFNNDGSKKSLLTTRKMYGWDNATTLYERGSHNQEFRLPVFGIKRDGAALLAIIEEGDAVADINGMLGDINHSWNTAYANFTIKNKDRFIEEGAFEQAPWVLYEQTPYRGGISVKYYFLTGHEADYVGMAKTYRNYLVDKGTLSLVDRDENIPFYIDTMGAVDMITRKMGIPVSNQVPITTFDQAQYMMDQLMQKGVRNIKLRYKGWYNGGLFYTAPAKMEVEKVLGGEKGLSELSKKALSLGLEIYPDIDLIQVPSSSMFDGFGPRKDSIRNLFQKIAFCSELQSSSLEYKNTMWFITPSRIPEYYDKFTKAYDKMDIPTISLSTMGQYLNSDFKNNNHINRQKAKDLKQEVLEKASKNYTGIISDYGNAYVFPYIDHLLNLPQGDSSLLISDKQIPFIQIVLHGYISYAGEALNAADDLRYEVLKAIEYGSSPYFKLNYGRNSILKNAGVYDQKNSLHFIDWEGEASMIYEEMNGVLKDVQDKVITDHKELMDGVFMTTYEDNRSIIINYNNETVVVDGATIKPLDFVVEK